ncbi:MAG: GGDEF domain-containing protein, partial [Acidimicrobiales bacterium]
MTATASNAVGEPLDLNARMFGIQRSISLRAPLQEVLDSITQGAAELLDAEVVGLRIQPGDGVGASHASLLGYSEDLLEAFAEMPLGHGFAGRAFSENRLVVSDDYQAERDRVGRNERYELQAAMATPVLEHGRPVGVINVASARPGRRFTTAEQKILVSLAEYASVAVTDAAAVDQLRRSLDRAEFEARHDGLTGLLNRDGAIATLDAAMAHASAERPLSLLFIDIDRFKVVNDLFGHQVGDQVLVEVASRLRSVVRGDDEVARLSGDEFVVIARGVDGAIAGRLAQRLLERVADPITIGDREVELTVSIGVAEADEPVAGESLLADADVAMYRAKQGGRCGMVRFDGKMRAELVDRAELERELRVALESAELSAYFQPGVDLSTGRIARVEALVRWKHPTRGLLEPDRFIEVAEETGIIAELDRFMLEESCRHLAAWSACRPDLSLSVNLSARHFKDDSLVAVVREVLQATGLDGSRLWLEITESVVMGEDSAALETMDRLKELGVRFMVDDFGTGYSSLIYLKRFPLDALKIHRGFVDGLGEDREDEAIVAAVIGLAAALGQSVVAEGVEHERQVAWLRDLGCPIAQGYLFSRP